MTQQDKQEIDKKCDEFCEYRRTHSNGYPPREWFMAGVKALDEIRKPSEPETNDGEAGEELVKVKSVESELIALQAFIITNLPSDVTEDYAFPNSTSRKTIRNVMRIINESNDRFMKRVRHSIAIREANNKVAELMQPDKELLKALKKICKVAPSYIKNPDDELDNAICEAMLAVYDYEQTDQMTYSDYVRKDLALEFATRFYQLMTSARVDEYIGARKDVCVNDLFEEFLKTKEDEKI